MNKLKSRILHMNENPDIVDRVSVRICHSHNSKLVKECCQTELNRFIDAVEH